ncbi:putative cytosol aminopeptidase [Planctomycetales bacterium 10988]|nr:putative cytosol aminopeptidase [Planctomycetales bacterium 10988]
MQLLTDSQPMSDATGNVLILGVYQSGELPPAAEAFEKQTEGLLGRLREQDEFCGKLGEMVVLFEVPSLKVSKVVLLGMGEREDLDQAAAFRLGATISKKLAAKPLDRMVVDLDEWTTPLVESALAGLMVGCENASLYQAEKKRFPIQEVVWRHATPGALESAKMLGESINLTRRLVNQPPEDLYPETFAQTAEEVARMADLEIEVWDQERLTEEKCGALLAVARGSARPPRLIILRHMGAEKDSPIMALVGKGVTFDSGGLSLKPSESMLNMKADMAGGATVLGAMQAIGWLKLPVNAIGVIGLVENMPGSQAYKLGDVLTSRNGKTIEVHNTDAEGRLVLADALDVACEQGADHLIDLATLTGACVVALGLEVAGVMSNDDEWQEIFLEAAKTSGEYAWPLPMFPEYRDQIRGTIADIKNVGNGRWGGAITAGKFLQEFVGDTPWVHVDIAGPSFIEKATDWQDTGGSGAFVRTLVEIARTWKPNSNQPSTL